MILFNHNLHESYACRIIVEYCANGNLRHYLIERRPKLIEEDATESDYLVPRTQQTQPSNLTLGDLVTYSRQIAKGMEYLASRKVIIHRYVCPSGCLLLLYHRSFNLLVPRRYVGKF